MTLQVTHPPKSCSVGSHQWITRRNDVGDHYELCVGCGKQASWVPLWATD